MQTTALCRALKGMGRLTKVMLHQSLSEVITPLTENASRMRVMHDECGIAVRHLLDADADQSLAITTLKVPLDTLRDAPARSSCDGVV